MISEELEISIQNAFEMAKLKKHEFLTLEHLMLELCKDNEILSLFTFHKVNHKKVISDLENFLENKLKDITVADETRPTPSAAFERVLKRAAQHVQSSGKKEVKALNILVAMYSERDSFAVYFLEKQKLTRLKAVSYISHSKDNKVDHNEDIATDNLEEKSNSKNKTILETFCINLNKKAKEGRIDPIIGRGEEIERTVQILCRRLKNNPLFVGDPGVGKTALAEGLAMKIVEKKVPKVLLNTKVFSLEMSTLLAGTRYRGDFEERLNNLLKELTSNRDNILFIDEIHTVIGAGATSGGSIDASNILKPALANGTLRCIGSTTYSEFRKYFEKDSALARRFQKIDIEEPSTSDAIKILKGISHIYENFHNIQYSEEAIEQAVQLSDRYINERKLPDKAIDILDEIGAAQNLKSGKNKIISSKEVADIVAKIARIPSKNINREDNKVLKNLAKNLKLSVFGQDKAINELSRVVRLSRSGLREKEKTIGSYLFVGPTGVGKTEIARVLANVLNIKLLRFDMSEYMERHSISRLIGSPPGYVGFDEGGALTEAVNKNPYAVLLLDEIEKAHPDIFNILLQIMDYGKLTDHNSRTIDFRNIILIMTSNVGASSLDKNKIGFTGNQTNEDNLQEINRMFSPEFRNRLDSVISFDFLSPKIMNSIVDKAISYLEGQLTEKNISIKLSNEAKKYLTIKGFDKKYGARPLQRLVQKEIKEPLAEEILFGKLKNGGLVNINLKDENLVFRFQK
ncbi:MAG: ATP-dependent Clp protease ATP-binding subunit ClpA [Alphaproteobacteria bacterium MarineAlpha9_Bin4]|nr:ATP-dependent Clp protease ATP-binding subunit ClpA [Pelagibacterales bacterium]PPR26680.1 MAG: ATP-dependent Clp protease ATP-binding subunit ClpA [Alphaproteobacteria bacterium MarineAlpha9_Bin4]